MDPAAPKSAGGSRGSGRGRDPDRWPGPSPCSPREPPPLSRGWQGRCQGPPTWTEEGRGPLGQCGHPPRLYPAPTHHMPIAGQRDKDVAALMDQQFAVDAPVALPGKAPYPFTALAAVRSLRGTRTAAVSRARCARGPRHAARTCCTVTMRSWGGRWPCRLVTPGTRPPPRLGSSVPRLGEPRPQGGRWGSAPCEGKGEAPAGRGDETPPRAAPPPRLAGTGLQGPEWES